MIPDSLPQGLAMVGQRHPAINVAEQLRRGKKKKRGGKKDEDEGEATEDEAADDEPEKQKKSTFGFYV